MGMTTLLTILFIGLKLTGYIDWSWFLVVAPTVLSVTTWIALVLLVAVKGHNKGSF